MNLTPIERDHIINGLYLLSEKLRVEGRANPEQTEIKFAQQKEVGDLTDRIRKHNVADNIFDG